MTELLRLNDIRAVILDWDGTVVDSVPYKIAQNYDLAHEFGNNLSIDDVRREWNASQGFPDLLERLTGSTDLAAVMEVVKRDYDNPAYAKREFAFAKAALQTIGRMGLELGVITNATREILTLDANSLQLNLDHFFDFTQAVDECPFKKPDARVFDPAKKYFKVTSAHMLYVGDEMKDYEAAKNAGAQFIGVTTGMTTAEEFTQAGINYTNNLAGVAQLLSAKDPRS